MKFPGLVITAGDTAEEKRRAAAVDFKVDLGVFKIQIWYGGLA
jgi:hypothetical protein